MLIEDSNRILVCGIGNTMRGDDAFGPLIVDFLSKKYSEIADYTKLSGDLTQIIDQWINRDVILFDSVSDKNGKAKIHEFDDFEELARFSGSMRGTHGIGLSEVLKLAGKLEMLPDSIKFFGVTGNNFELNSRISPEITELNASIEKKFLNYIRQIKKKV